MRRPVVAVVAALAVLMPANGAAQDYETTRIAEGVYQFRYIGHNAMFVLTTEGVVAFDPISTDAARALASEIRRVAPGTGLRAIVYSHSDADHATGARALMQAMGQTDVRIIAHERAVAPIAEQGDPALPAPNVTFADRLTMTLGGRDVELHYLGPSHTDNMIVGFVPDVRVAFAVDFVANDRVGYQTLPGWHFPDFFGAVSALLDIPFETIVFGHGPPGDRASIHRQITYYDDLTAAVRAAIERGLSEDEAAEQVRLPRYESFGQYGAWFPMNVRGVYRWLSASDAR